MRVKKITSKMLLVSILLNNLSILANAKNLSVDTRYESFKDSNIAISDVAEEGLVDVGIEGNTLVNLAKGDAYSLIQSDRDSLDNLITSNNLDVETSERYLRVTTNEEVINNAPIWMYTKLGDIKLDMLKPNTQYTVIGDIIKGVTSICIMNGNATKILAEYSKVNNNKALLTTNNFDKDDLSSQIIYGYTNNYKTHPIDIEVKNVMLFEGDLTDMNNVEYFKDIMSAGQVDEGERKISISSFNNGNLIKDTTFTNGFYIVRENGKPKEHEGFSYTDYIDVLPNKIIHVYNTNLNCAFYDKNKNFLGRVLPIRRSDCLAGVDSSFSVLTPDDAKYVRFSVPIENQGVAKAGYVQDVILNKEVKFNKKDVLLNEPLRGLSNGVKDRIIKKDGRWYIERNCKALKLNGFENWRERAHPSSDYDKYTYDIRLTEGSLNLNDSDIKAVSDKLPYDKSVVSPMDWSIKISGDGDWFILRTDANLNSVAKLKEYLSEKNLNIVYALRTPTYEPLNIEPTVSLYEGTTYISNDSIVPANMSVIVDRALNLANKYVELAKDNPTVENISRARSWINLLDSSMIKDQLQAEINDISEITDLTFEKKSATNNVDIYIESENMLSLSLDTNSIVFNDFSGVEDVIKENAVNLTVNSSLPYAINAYLESEIQNSDKSKAIDKSVLNIKDSGEASYKEFSSIKNKVVLKDGCDKGNNINHSIDFKLKGNKAFEADAYKAVVKFEVEQK